jgi:phosphonate transport system substrate-binding protein
MSGRRKFLKLAGTTGIAGLTGCLGLGGGSDSEAFGDGTLNFYMSPSEPQDLMLKQYAPVKDYLNENVEDTELTYAKDYAAVIQSLGSGTGDVAETGPFAAALGVNSDKAQIALQRFAYGSWDYVSTIVTKEDSDIQSLSDLEGKKIALADRLSASGSLFPLYMLKNRGNLAIGKLPTGSDNNADFSANYAGGHGAAFAALESGQVDAAGVGQFITLNDDRKLKSGYRYVDTYEGIPRAPIVTSPELSDENKEKVVNALKDAPESMYLGKDGKKDTKDDLWFSDVRPANVDTYQPVIDVAKDLGISLDQL